MTIIFLPAAEQHPTISRFHCILVKSEQHSYLIDELYRVFFASSICGGSGCYFFFSPDPCYHLQEGWWTELSHPTRGARRSWRRLVPFPHVGKERGEWVGSLTFPELWLFSTPQSRKIVWLSIKMSKKQDFDLFFILYPCYPSPPKWEISLLRIDPVPMCAHFPPPPKR